MTTDTVPKTAVVRGSGFTVGAMAKGAAMLAPNMATMLALCTTDAAVEPGALQAALRAAVDVSFNAMTVDGCTSTNDTVLVLASGRGDAVALGRRSPPRSSEACISLAEQMVRRRRRGHQGVARARDRARRAMRRRTWRRARWPTPCSCSARSTGRIPTGAAW